MLKRKASKTANHTPAKRAHSKVAAKAAPAKHAAEATAHDKAKKDQRAKVVAAAGKSAGPATPATTAATGPATEANLLMTRVDLNETMKALVHLAHENGYLTYDDINDLLPEGLSPEELDEVLTKLRGNFRFIERYIRR